MPLIFDALPQAAAQKATPRYAEMPPIAMPPRALLLSLIISIRRHTPFDTFHFATTLLF